MLTVLLSVLALCAAMLTIRARYKDARPYLYVFKPLGTVLILLIALQGSRQVAPFYRYAIVAGLGFSLVGDVLLMLQSDRFVAGLASFLLAHLSYIVAFSSGTGFGFSVWPLAPFLLYVIIVFLILRPHLGKMTLPVLI